MKYFLILIFSINLFSLEIIECDLNIALDTIDTWEHYIHENELFEKINPNSRERLNDLHSIIIDFRKKYNNNNNDLLFLCALDKQQNEIQGISALIFNDKSKKTAVALLASAPWNIPGVAESRRMRLVGTKLIERIIIITLAKNYIAIYLRPTESSEPFYIKNKFELSGQFMERSLSNVIKASSYFLSPPSYFEANPNTYSINSYYNDKNN